WPGAAGATTETVHDTRGNLGLFDLATASSATAGGKLVFTATTFGAWPATALKSTKADFNAFMVALDTNADQRIDYTVFGVFYGGKLHGDVLEAAHGHYLGSASVAHPNAHAIQITVNPSTVSNPKGFNWGIVSFYQDSGTCKKSCVD